MMVRKNSKPFLIAAVFFGGVVVTLVVVAVVWVGALRPSSGPESASASVSPPNSPFQPVRPCTGPVSTDVRRVQKVTFADPRQVDAAEAFPAALEVAKAFSPDVGLFGISSGLAAQSGKFDLSENPLIFSFEYRCNLPNLPAGKDLRAGHLSVAVSAAAIRAEHLPNPTGLGMSAARPPLDMPPCPSSAAFALAVATGVPSNTAATFVYTWAGDLFPGGAWLITVGGHGEFRREVEGKGCARIAQNDQELKGISAPNLPSLPKAELSPEPPKVTHGSAPPRNEPPMRFQMEGVDFERADVTDLLPHAKKLALKVNAAAVLVGISAERLEGGLVNLSERSIVGGVRATFSFEYRREDREQDKETPAEGGIVVSAHDARWEVSQTFGTATLLRESGFPKGGLNDAPCRSKDAWTAIGESGIAQRLWYGLGEGKYAEKAVWRWDRGDRSIFVDAKTCRMVAP